ncbi:MAG: AAA family ATPase, partial [Desulfobulbaceae bacterium]|nr:AAA family ATPase [Desulfobulbaceae bacterium]
SYQRIVADLENKQQEAIVSAGENKNMLILAGPGSGKTRTVVHRCAYLLRVKRVRPESILVLCFNRNAAMTLRRRLLNLVKDDARGVMIQTYHSLAMRLTGRSVRGLEEGGGKGEPDFDALIREAVQLLKGEKKNLPGLEADEVRDRLLGGYRHILVDEYQDIDSDQYELVSALVGRAIDDGDRRLTILAVGDDDQNIYQFRGTNVEFIKRFREDYQADIFYLNENYRSNANIIQASNEVIANNRDRMKTAHPMRINRARGNLPAGGGWERLDPLAKGRVQVMQSENAARQAVALVLEMERLSRLSPAWQWGEVAVLAREWSILQPIRLLCEQLNIPISRTFSGRVPIFRIREIYDFFAVLKEKENGWYIADELNSIARPGPEEPYSIWFQVLGKVVEDWRSEAGEEKQPVNFVLDFFYDALAQQRKEGRFGTGLFLGTAHSAKGMEFAHVFIPDGGWGRGEGSGEREEARRLYYVAMTRARETLTLFERGDCTGHLADQVEGEGALHRKGQNDEKLMQSVCREEYSMLGLEDMYLDYAASFSKDHGVHRTLSRLRTGDRLQLREDKGRLCLFFETVPVAALSKRGEQQWRARLDQVNYAEIIAMIYRKREDSAQEYQGRCRLEQWELPLVELRHGTG